MNLDDLLRAYARQDLQQFCPAAHYWLREHNPIADRELTEPLLREPMRFGLTPRELVAATALGQLTTYTITSRAIYTKAYQSQDISDPAPLTGMTFDQEREIWALYEVFRSTALVYARILPDEQLIEHYRTPQTEPTQDSAMPTPVSVVQATETKEQRQDRRLKACIDAGLPMNGMAAILRLPDGVAKIAENEGVTRQTFSTDVKAALERRDSAKKEGVTVHRT